MDRKITQLLYRFVCLKIGLSRFARSRGKTMVTCYPSGWNDSQLFWLIRKVRKLGRFLGAFVFGFECRECGRSSGVIELIAWTSIGNIFARNLLQSHMATERRPFFWMIIHVQGCICTAVITVKEGHYTHTAHPRRTFTMNSHCSIFIFQLPPLNKQANRQATKQKKNNKQKMERK